MRDFISYSPFFSADCRLSTIFDPMNLSVRQLEIIYRGSLALRGIAVAALIADDYIDGSEIIIMESDVLPLFEGRILPFDLKASGAFAELMARAQKSGRAIGTADGYIAAIAASRGLIVATRDISGFDAAGVPVINPWATRA